MLDLIPFALFGSGVWFGIITVLFLILLLVSDYNQSGLAATIFFCVFIGLNFFWGTLPLEDYFSFRNISIYLFIGLVFSMLRTYLRGKELKRNGKTAKNYYSFFQTEMRDDVFRWIFLFPFSMINWFFGSFISDAWKFTYTKVGFLYERILNIGIGDTKDETKKE